MITVKQNTTLVGVSELRKGIDAILEKTRHGLVVIEKRHKPAAVLMSNDEYESMQAMLEIAEDLVLGYMARERHANSRDKDYIDIENLLKKTAK
jgi:prevent-host-death family protein